MSEPAVATTTVAVDSETPAIASTSTTTPTSSASSSWWMRWADRVGLGSVAVNAGSVIGTSVVTSVLGAVYWWVAARFFTTADVGIASAGISATVLMGTLSVLGTGTLLIGELPRLGTVERVRMIVTAILVCGFVGTVTGALFAIFAPAISSNLGPLGAGPFGIALFALSVSSIAVGTVLDHAFIGVLRGQYHLWRNTLVSIGKLPALIVIVLLPFEHGALSLYGTGLVGALLSFAVVIPLAGFGRLPLIAYRPRWSMLRHHGQLALEHHALNLSLQVPGLLMPLLVTVLLSPTLNAYFYLGSMFANFVFILPTALSTALYAAGAHDPATFARKMRLTLGLSLSGGLLAVVVLSVIAPPLLAIFGRTYADEVGWVFRGLLLGVFPASFKAHFVAISQVRRRVRQAALMMIAAAVAELVCAAAGAYVGGLHGLVVAMVGMLYLEAILFAPVIVRAAIRGVSPASPV